MNRRDFVRRLLQFRGDALLTSSLGNPTYDLAAAGDSPANFYFWGAMGGAAAFSLGLALVQPSRRVVALLGDGELMMALGSLATIGVQKPSNLSVVILDNLAFAETGAQTGLTASGIDLAGMALAAGFTSATTITSIEQVKSLAHEVFELPGPTFVRVEVAMSADSRIVPEWDGAVLARRTRRHIAQQSIGNDSAL